MFGLIKRLFLILPALIGVAIGGAVATYGYYAIDAVCPRGEPSGWYFVALAGAMVFVGLGGLFALISVIAGKGEAIWRAVFPPILLAAAVAAAPHVLDIPAVKLAAGGLSVCAAE